MAPAGAEVYVDDERQGSIGRSGRVILKSIPPGKHVLRVAHAGDRDDERVIESSS
jgi:outer membrane usher protein FimD/PapC